MPMVQCGTWHPSSYDAETEYFFTGPEAVKPEMIREATQDARQAAQ